METSFIFSADGVGGIATSPSTDHQNLVRSPTAMNHDVIATHFSAWPTTLEHCPDPTILVTTPGLFCPSTTHYHNEAWSDISGETAHAEPPTSSRIDPLDPALLVMTGASAGDSAIGSIDHTLSETAGPAIVDPIALLSQIQLKLRGVPTRRPPQAAELQATVNQAFQISQHFVDVLDQILTPRTAESSPSSAHQHQHAPHAAPASDKSISFNEDSTSHLKWTAGKQPERQLRYAQIGSADTGVIQSALTCYIQFLRSYKNLASTLFDSVTMIETQRQLDFSESVPVQIGTLHTMASPRLHIALLVQLILQSVEEIGHKTRLLATRVNEARPNMDPSHPEAFIGNTINKDIRDEEEGLQDGLNLLSVRLKMHAQFQDHRS
ncbi:hypothetical protein GGI42DRAFT_337554 [Trichoderma sp. SZMC 28013]